MNQFYEMQVLGFYHQCLCEMDNPRLRRIVLRNLSAMEQDSCSPEVLPAIARLRAIVQEKLEDEIIV